MTLKLTTIDERLQEQCVKGVLFGPPKIGKTSQLWTLDAESTLFLDLEAGGLSVQGWTGNSIELKTWDDCRDMAAVLVGPDPAKRARQAYNQGHYDFAKERLSAIGDLSKYKTWFVDSITVASRICLNWCLAQPEALTKNSQTDTRGAYGLLGIEMVNWLTHLQHAKGVNVWFAAILDEKKDEFDRTVFIPQIEGTATGLKLPGIVDQVVSMIEVMGDQGPYRAFVCKRPNQWNVPAGDRSGRLDLIEPPNLGQLMNKILQPISWARSERLEYNMPTNGGTDQHV
jgi:hypothetical protein